MLCFQKVFAFIGLRNVSIQAPVGSIPGRVKSNIYSLTKWTRNSIWHFALLGTSKGWLAESRDNVGEWDIVSWCRGKGAGGTIKSLCVLPLPVLTCLFVCSLMFYILSTSTILTGCVHSWQLYSSAPPENYATGMMTQYPTQTHY